MGKLSLSSTLAKLLKEGTVATRYKVYAPILNRKEICGNK